MAGLALRSGHTWKIDVRDVEPMSSAALTFYRSERLRRLADPVAIYRLGQYTQSDGDSWMEQAVAEAGKAQGVAIACHPRQLSTLAADLQRLQEPDTRLEVLHLTPHALYRQAARLIEAGGVRAARRRTKKPDDLLGFLVAQVKVKMIRPTRTPKKCKPPQSTEATP